MLYHEFKQKQLQALWIQKKCGKKCGLEVITPSPRRQPSLAWLQEPSNPTLDP